MTYTDSWKSSQIGILDMRLQDTYEFAEMTRSPPKKSPNLITSPYNVVNVSV